MRYGPQTRYLFRNVFFLAPLLGLWWTLLLDPLLAGLRLSTEEVLRLFLRGHPPAEVVIAPDGNWLFRVPLPAAVARRGEIQRLFGQRPPDTPYVTVRSLRIQIPGRDPSVFVITLPFFWAVLLAQPSWSGRTLRALAGGTCLLLPFAVILMVFEVVRSFMINTHLAIPPLAATLLQAWDQIALTAVPFVTPVLLALWLDNGFRALVFSRQVASRQATPADADSALGRPRQRHWQKAARAR